MCNYERLLDESEKDKVFHVYVNQGTGYPQKDIFEMLTEAQDNKSVTARDQEWFKWAEDMALKVKVETLKEIGEWLQKKCQSMSNTSRYRNYSSKYTININTKELEAFKQGRMIE